MEPRTLLKGFAMGISDTVPGISGGTIAFITGIYYRLINTINNLTTLASITALFLLQKKKWSEVQKQARQTDIKFLATLLLGIILAILLFSHILTYLLTNHEPYILAFFTGIILVSILHLFEHIKTHNHKNWLAAIIGLGIGIALIIITPTNMNVSTGYLFLNGLIASSAMILPGISGSYILLIMGSYTYILGLITNAWSNVGLLTIFAIGVLTGIMIMTKIINHLLQTHKSTTLYFLTGLVIGSLSKPIQTVLANGGTRTSIEWVLLTTLLGLGGILAGILLVMKRKS